MLTLQNIRINRLQNPRLVWVTEPPRFSWQLSSAEQGCLQTAYRVEVYQNSTPVFDSGKVESDKSVDVLCPALQLTPHTDYTATVTVWDNHGACAKGETAFSTALGKEGWLGAEWITPKRQVEGASPYLRRKFEVKKPVTKATLFASGLGLSEYYLNGEAISEGRIDPIATNYEKTVFYRFFDLTDRIRIGGNALAVWLGDGFWGQNRLWLDHAEPRYGEVCCIARLHILYTDGTEENIVSAPDWEAKPSPITLNNLYAGELYDARMEDRDFAFFTGDEDGWGKTKLATPPKGELVGCDLPAVKVIKTLPARSVSPVSGKHDGAFIFDFGENFAGVFTAKIPPSPAGATYVFRMAETLQDSHLDYRTTGSYATECIQQDIYIASGNPEGEEYTPRFTYHGFRYLEVTGYYALADGYGALPRQDAIIGIALSTEMEETGDFQCDYTPLNTLFGMMKHTFRANYHGFPEDCPAREKCGWLGDAQAVCDFGLLSYDTTALYEKYMDDIATTKAVYGNLKMISPGRRGCGDATPLWGCAQILIPYALWQYAGDEYAILRHLPLMHEWAESEAGRAKDYLLSDGLGDWVPPVGNNSPLRMPVSHSSTLMFYEICHKMAQICAHFDTPKQNRYEGLKESIKTAFISAFYREDAHTYGYDGTDAVALMFGIYPEGEEAALQKSLIQRLQKSDFQMTTAIYGTKYLVPALLCRGHGDDAMKMLFHPTHPAYGTMLAQGATTLWEDLSMTVPQPSKNQQLHSLNHPMHGGFLYSTYTHLAGLMPKEAGYKTFWFAPVPNAPVDRFSAHISTPYGKVSVKGQKEENQIRFVLTVPENSQAILDISWAKSIEIGKTPAQNGDVLGSGTHFITART